jgi:hypothetical protein
LQVIALDVAQNGVSLQTMDGKNFVGMILSIEAAGKIDAGTSSHRQQPSQMEAFRGQAMLRAEFGENGKGKNQSDQIRAPRCSCMSPSYQDLPTFFSNTSNKSTFSKKKIKR